MTTVDQTSGSDRGTILPMVLVVTVVLAVVVVAVATYVTTDLRYGRVVEARAGRIAAAQGALDDTLEQLSLRTSVCTTAVGAQQVNFPEPINGADVVVDCSYVSGAVPPADGFALVITGEGAPSPTTRTINMPLSEDTEIKGPVFLERRNTVFLGSAGPHQLTIEEGDVWYPDDACAGAAYADPEVQFARPTPQPAIAKLSFDPTARGFICVNRTWSSLFGTGPTIPTTLGSLPVNPPFTTVGGCRVFEPGRYTSSGFSSATLASNNYFKSGEYVFDNVGLISIQNKKVTMGQLAKSGYPAIGNVPCDSPDPDGGGPLPPGGRLNDVPSGATLYTAGNTQVQVRANGKFEVSGRLQGDTFVALQVQNTTLGFGDGLLAADSGGGKEMSMQGLVWAPLNSLVFDTIPVKTAAVLRGGAVIASLQGSYATGDGFLIQVGSSSAVAKLLIESTATDPEGQNVVRSIVDYRPSTGEIAVNSRRILK